MPNEKPKCTDCRRSKKQCLPEGRADDEICDRCRVRGLPCGPAVLASGASRASGASVTSIVNRARSTGYHTPSTMTPADTTFLGGATSFDLDSNNGHEQGGIALMDQFIGSFSADSAWTAQADTYPSFSPTFFGPIPPSYIPDPWATPQQMSIASNEAFLSIPMTPSDTSGHTDMSYRLVNRMNRLWGNAQAFRQNSEISEVFARSITEFFRNTCPLYANAYVMVRDAWYACIASDAMMNNTLPEPVWQDINKFYIEHCYKAWNAIRSALLSIREQGNAGDIDVTQLYFAVFLTYSSIACVRGRRDIIREANEIFERLGQLGAAFPIGIEYKGGSDKNWEVRMFLTNNPQDGMEIRYSSFFLARKRKEVDSSGGIL